MNKFLCLILVLVVSFVSACNTNKNDVNQLTVYVVRHAEAYKNLNPLPNMPKEKLDSLTPKGVEQANLIGKALKKVDIATIFTSPTGRTKETGAIIGQAFSSPVNVMTSPALVSLNNGKDEKGNSNTFEWRETQWDKNLDPKPNGGESMQEGAMRIIGFVNQYRQSNKGTSIVLVTHGDICAAILGQAAKTPYAMRYKKHTIPTGSFKKIVIIGNNWYLKD
jgi:broad specificity phosphatase PhoE